MHDAQDTSGDHGRQHPGLKGRRVAIALVGAWLVLTVVPTLVISTGTYPLGFGRAYHATDRPRFLLVFTLVAMVSVMFALVAGAAMSARFKTYHRAQHARPRAYGFESYRGPDGRFRSYYKSYHDDQITWRGVARPVRMWLPFCSLGAYVAAMIQWGRLSHTQFYSRSWDRPYGLRESDFGISIAVVALLTFAALLGAGILVLKARASAGTPRGSPADG